MPNVPSNSARMSQPSRHLATMPDERTDVRSAPDMRPVISGARLAGKSSTNVVVA